MTSFLNKCRKSWTLNGNMIAAILIGMQDNLGLLQLPQDYHKWALFIIIIMNIVLRFKTSTAIGDK